MATIQLIQNTFCGQAGGHQVRPGTPEQIQVKFDPGFYWAALMSGGAGGDQSMYGVTKWTEIKNEINDPNTNIRGVLLRFNWREIETSKGVYTVAGVKKAHDQLAALSNGPGKLAMMIEYRTTAGNGGNPGPVTPDYIINDPIYQGASYKSGSVNTAGNVNRYMRLWVPELVERLKLLSDYLASQLDDLPHFTMLQFSETIIGAAMQGEVVPAGYDSTNSAQNGSYAKGMRDWVLYTNQKFQKTIITQLCNFPQPLLTNYIPVLRDAGVGISCPNSMKDEPGLIRETGNIGIWAWAKRTDAQKIQDKTIFAPHVQIPECYYSNMSFDNASLDGLGRKPGQGMVPQYGVSGAKEIIDFCKTGKPHYIFVTRAPIDTRANVVANNPNGIIDEDWKDFFALPAQASTVHGGLNNVLPDNLVT